MPDMNDVFYFGDKAVDSILNLIEDLIKLLKERDGQECYKDMHQYLKNGGMINSREVKDVSIIDFEKRLQEEGITFIRIRSKINDVPAVAYKIEDEPRVAAIVAELAVNQNRMNCLKSEDFYLINKKNEIAKVDNINLNDAQLLALKAKRLDFAFTRISNDDGTYSICVNRKDISKLRKALLAISLESLGEVGNVNKQNNEKSLQTVLEAKDLAFVPDVDKYIHSSYNIDTSDEYIHMTEDGFSHYRNGNLVLDVNIKNSSNYEQDLYNALMSIENPVILTPEESYLNKQERNDIIKNKFNRAMVSADKVDFAEIEETVTKDILKMALNPNSDQVNFNQIIEKYETIEEQEYAQNFINKAVEYNKKFEIDFVKNIHDIEAFEKVKESINLELPLGHDDKELGQETRNNENINR